MFYFGNYTTKDVRKIYSEILEWYDDYMFWDIGAVSVYDIVDWKGQTIVFGKNVTIVLANKIIRNGGEFRL